MPDQYRLRLKDGTVLKVDHDGLRTWLLEEKVMVQPPGSRRWQPLKHVLAQPRPEPAPLPIRPPSVEPPAPKKLADHEIPFIPFAQPEDDVLARNPMVGPLAEATAPLAEPTERRDRPTTPRDKPTAPRANPIAPRPARPDDAVPVIRLKPLDDEVAPEPPSQSLLDVASAELERHGGGHGPWRWTAPEPRAASASANSASASQPWAGEGEGSLEELELIAERPRVPPKVAALLGHVSVGIDRLIRRARAFDLGRLRGKRPLRIAGLAAAAVLLAATSPAWIAMLNRLGHALLAEDGARAQPAPVAAPARPKEEPPLPPEVQVAASELPHLAPETVQLLMSSVAGPSDPPDLFRRATTAAKRGTAALTPAETQELGALRGKALAALRPVDRDRVRAYDRISAGRDLLSGEDARVLRLYARGVRTLPPESRTRLQTLYSKAIAAAR